MTTRHWAVRRIAAPFLAAAVLATAGCEGLFDIENPGVVLDDDLNDPEMVPVLITGLSSDFSDIYDEHALAIARGTDELAGTGSYGTTRELAAGVFQPDADAEDTWEQAHEARWMAELHLERIQELIPETFENNRHVARAYVFAGIANNTLGENFCAVTYSDPDAGPGEYGELKPREAAFERAIADLQSALGHADTIPYLTAAAHAGLAQAYVGLGDWSAAVQHSSQVPTDFEFVAFYDQVDNSNLMVLETHNRHEASAILTLAGSFDPPDARAPYTKCGTYTADGGVSDGPGNCPSGRGADGNNPHWRQEKYDDQGDEIPVAKGTEMRLIEAEAAVRQGDLATFTAKVNEVRAFYGEEPIEQPATAGAIEYPNAQDDAWSILDRERHLTLWLEGRRLWDLHRWDHPFLDGHGIIYPAEPRRASCMPIPDSECRNNPNVPCG